MLNSRVALALAVLAILLGGAAVYVPAAHISSQIDRALQQEEDAVASALRARLLADAERNVSAVAALLSMRSSDQLDAQFGDQIRVALEVNAIVLLDDKGEARNAYTTFDTPAGLGRTLSTRAIAQRITARHTADLLSSFVRAYGQTYVVAAARVPPPAGGAERSSDLAVAIIFTRIETGMLARLSQDHGLVGLNLVEALPPPIPSWRCTTSTMARRDT